MKIKKRKPANETPCSICGAKKRLAEVGVTRDIDGKGRKYDCWRCNICDYPVYVTHNRNIEKEDVCPICNQSRDVCKATADNTHFKTATPKLKL